MPITKSAKKAIRSSARKHDFNIRRSNAMKEVVKNIRKFVKDGDIKKAKELLPQAQKAIDKALKRGILKKNTAARKKSRLSAFLKKNS